MTKWKALQREDFRRGVLWAGALVTTCLAGGACTSTPEGPPEEFPPVTLGMPVEEVRAALESDGGTVEEVGEDVLEATGRDVRVSEESFLFYNGRLAAWRIAFAEESNRRSFMRISRRFTLAYGEPMEEQDNGFVLRSQWRIPESGGQLLLSADVSGRNLGEAIYARLEDPSVRDRLIREMNRQSPPDETSPTPDQDDPGD